MLISAFWATFWQLFSRYREILLSAIYMPNFRSIGPFKHKLGGADSAPPPRPYQYAKSPACSPCIMCVQYIGGYREYIGGYYEYIGGCSVHRRDTMSTSGGYHEYIGGYHEYIRDVQYIGGIS